MQAKILIQNIYNAIQKLCFSTKQYVFLFKILDDGFDRNKPVTNKQAQSIFILHHYTVI